MQRLTPSVNATQIMLLGQVSPAPQWMEQKSGVVPLAVWTSQKAENPATALQTPVAAQLGVHMP